MRTTLNVLVIAALAALGTFAGATGHAIGSLVSGEVTHLVFEAKYSDSPASIRIEQWLDESRSLAREVQSSAEGPVVNATGLDWWLHIPAIGPSQLYETYRPGSPATRSIVWRLFYLRDALQATQARVSFLSETESLIQQGRRTALYDRASGLPRWEDFGEVRVDYTYLVSEKVPARDYQTSFFRAGAENVTTLTRNVPLGERTNTRFPLAMTSLTVAGRAWTSTVTADVPSERVQQQVISQFGSDLVIEEALLTEAPAEVRPGGTPVETSVGPGRLFEESVGWHLMVLRGRHAVNVHGRDLEAVRTAGFSLR